MPSFHRPPEWQQQADRHTELVDPVLTVRQLGRFDLNLKSLIRIDHALVFSTPKGGYDPYLPPRRPTRSEIAANRYTAVYEVDMGVHPFSAELALPSDNDAFEFTAAVELSWQVLDPARFVASGHRDVPGLVLGELQRAARPVTRRFAIADSADAERELLQAVTVLGPLGAPAGLQVTWTLRLRRDQENIDHQRRLQAIDHSAAEQIRAAERGMEIDVEVDRRNRQQDHLQIGRATDYGRQQQELILQQQRWQHELALQQGEQMLELQRIEAKKIEFFQWHLSQGGVQAWAMHLAQHPEDSRLVMTSMREDQLHMIQAQMDLVGQLLSGDTAESYELEGPKQLALRTVSDILNQRLPGVPQTPPLIAPQGDGPGYPDTPDHQGPGSQAPDGQAPLPRPSAQVPAQPPAPPGPPAPPAPPALPAQHPAAAAPGPPLPGRPAWQPSTPYAPPPTPYAPPLTLPGSHPGAPAPPAAPEQTPAWQPPPGYGSTPTLPAQAPPPEPGHPSDQRPQSDSDDSNNSQEASDT
ncbi:MULTISPECIES: hypothetical protein [unclassified Streptomyces]|uniref:hypothetical protein n=1 Tax=unclassified Streptomyces TaxID=2593676 RepID=UPI0022518667|nr:hypothetical protein [Streptomyces sp. NBC_00452]MCX5060777.1 hypothetical protein [Streptomyces sp. NBC_00452]